MKNNRVTRLMTASERAAYINGIEDAARRMGEIVSIMRAVKKPTEAGRQVATLLSDYVDFIRRLKIDTENTYRTLKVTKS